MHTDNRNYRKQNKTVYHNHICCPPKTQTKLNPKLNPELHPKLNQVVHTDIPYNQHRLLLTAFVALQDVALEAGLFHFFLEAGLLYFFKLVFCCPDALNDVALNVGLLFSSD